MAYLKPQSPLKQGEDYIYPVTTYDQVITPTGERWNGTIVRATDTEPEDAEIWIDTSDGIESSLEVMRADAIKYLAFSIGTGDWVLSNSVYTYTISKGAITSTMALLNLAIDATSQSYLSAAIEWETTDGALILSTTTKPSGAVNGYCILTEVDVL